MKFVVRLFPEITIKSAPVRKRLTKMLTESLRVLLKRIDASVQVTRDWDKLDVNVASDDPGVELQIVECLACTPGIAHFFRVKQYRFETLHDIYELALEAWKEDVEGLTFCVRAKRTGHHEFTSTEVERYVGGGINQHTHAAGVKLKNPDITLNMEIKGQTLYLVEKRYSGSGGFPIGSQEDVLSLISGGFDSTVASYLTIKRGLKTHFCFFNLGGAEHETAVKEVAFYLWNRYASSHRVRFIAVPFEGVVNEILQKVSPANMGVILKRMMLRAAEKVAERGGIDALVTGEAVAQVSSQTLPNLSVIDRVCSKLVLRPLITMDKGDIIDISRKIGAEEFSAAIPEYCGVISVKPSAKVKLAKVEEEEALFSDEVLNEALNNCTVQNIDEVMNGLKAGVEPEIINAAPPGAVVVDIRHESEKDVRPLAISGEVTLIHVPFYQLSSEFEKLEQDRQYLLYCDKGVMSKLHAAHLMDQGFENVGVYRPQFFS